MTNRNMQPSAQEPRRVPRSRIDDLWVSGDAYDASRFITGIVASIDGPDTVSCTITDGSLVTGILVLGSMPEVGEVVEIEIRGDLFVINRSSEVDGMDDDIQSAYDKAVEALDKADQSFDFAAAANAAYRQPSAPTNPDAQGRPLAKNDTWFDTDDSNKPYYWSGSAWVDATTSWLRSNPSTVFPNMVLSPQGLAAFNGIGNTVTSISSTTGAITTVGPIVTAGDISGATITANGPDGATGPGAGVIQTTAAQKRGIKMNSLGLMGYSDGSGGIAAGQPTFSIDAVTGAATFLGSILSGSSITGASVSGGTFSTGDVGPNIWIGTQYVSPPHGSSYSAGHIKLRDGTTELGGLTGRNVMGMAPQVTLYGPDSQYLLMQHVEGGGTSMTLNAPQGLWLGGSNLNIEGFKMQGALTMNDNNINQCPEVNNGSGTVVLNINNGKAKISSGTNTNCRFGSDPVTAGTGSSITIYPNRICAASDNYNVAGTPTSATGLQPFWAAAVHAFAAYDNASDARLKENITDVDADFATDVVRRLRVRSFSMPEVKVDEHIDPNRTQYGVVAQEALDVLPSAILGSEETVYSASYQDVWAMNLRATQALLDQVERQQKQIDDLTARVAALEEGR